MKLTTFLLLYIFLNYNTFSMILRFRLRSSAIFLSSSTIFRFLFTSSIQLVLFLLFLFFFLFSFFFSKISPYPISNCNHNPVVAFQHAQTTSIVFQFLYYSITSGVHKIANFEIGNCYGNLPYHVQ